MKRKYSVLQNAKWIVGCKILQAILQLIIGMLTARYLGPSEYGLVNYAASVTAFAMPFMQLGLQYTLVQEYIETPSKSAEILGTGLTMTVGSALLSALGVIGFALAANWGETTTILVCVLYSATLFCQALEMIQYWFQAKMLSKYSTLAMLGAYLLVSAYKVYLLITGKSVFWFALSHAVEHGTAGILMLIVQYKLDGQKLRFSAARAKKLFSRSKYYILASAMATVYHNTDHIMLTLIAGNAENGFYATAFTCTSIANFLYYGLADAARPAILERREKSYGEFQKGIVVFYAVIIWLSIMQTVASVIFARPIVTILYGQDYLPAVPVFRVMALQLTFANMGIVRNIWLLGAEQHNILWKVNLCGIFANVVMNIWMIPIWGACGAALASALTQATVNFVLGFVIRELRPNNRLLMKGMNPRVLLTALKEQWLR